MISTEIAGTTKSRIIVIAFVAYIVQLAIIAINTIIKSATNSRDVAMNRVSYELP
ncbi:MAG: hypothetical protein ACLTAI_08170 [Thomasclavelia sp.]